MDFEVLNFGSLNCDHVYRVDHFVRPGETMQSLSYISNAGGKGLNQSVALARAGVRVAHAGKIGPDGEALVDVLKNVGADVSRILRGTVPTGHAIIQVEEKSGQNSILLYPGANMAFTEEEINALLGENGSVRWLMLQNEINFIPQIMRSAKEKGYKIAFNPAPCGPEVRDYPIDLCDLLLVNEIEGAELVGLTPGSDPDVIISRLAECCPQTEVVLTYGAQGAWYAYRSERMFSAPPQVAVVDTTSAGDTFGGYFLAARLRGYEPCRALETASRAAGITISRHGAAVSIPMAAEVFQE